MTSAVSQQCRLQKRNWQLPRFLGSMMYVTVINLIGIQTYKVRLQSEFTYKLLLLHDHDHYIYVYINVCVYGFLCVMWVCWSVAEALWEKPKVPPLPTFGGLALQPEVPFQNKKMKTHHVQ